MSDGPAQKPPTAQIPLDLLLEPSFAREQFLPAPSNVGALAAIDAWPDWPGRILLLVGPPGSGKSHLAAIWARKTNAAFLDPEAFPALAALARSPHAAFAVDGLERVADETALFHLLNFANEHDLSLLLTARQAPRDTLFRLPDLLSRIRRATLVEIGAPDDELIRAVLEKLFRDRQLTVDAGLKDYLALRLERSLEAARAFVGALDHEALARGKGVTRALAGELMDRLRAADDT